ncbi:MAG: thioredoxin [Bacteroidales bacterium]|nr:thioredoxin [Bacteroidales bacterium]MDZ4203359.1 thioredoxin [Bacteroidales bacterium]
MKNLILTLSLAIIMLTGACTSPQQQNNLTTDKTIQSVEGKVTKLDKDAFLNLVFNYEVNPEKWVYEGDLPAIIDFYADWCAPCRLVAPIMDQLADEYKGKIRIYKIDTDKQKELASVFNVRNLPSILFIPMKGQPQMTMGALPKETFKQVIEEFLLTEKQ